MAAPAGATNNPLFRFGVDLDGVDAQTGRTALHSAAMFADADKVRRPVVRAGVQPARVQLYNVAIDHSACWDATERVSSVLLKLYSDSTVGVRFARQTHNFVCST